MTIAQQGATPIGTALPGTTTSAPSRESRRGLDWFVFFVADIQTGFGPFVAVYLTAEKWTQTDIGLILTVAGIVGLIAQVPGGALVDWLRSLRAASALAVFGIGASAFALAAWPVFPIVLASRVVHATSSSVLGPAIASMSLNLVDRKEIGRRLGRNASFASIGTGLTAVGMGACGTYVSNQAVFFVAAALIVPALFALYRIRPSEIGPRPSGPEKASSGGADPIWLGLMALARSRALLVFAASMVFFQLANASMLQLAAGQLTLHSGSTASALVAAAIVVPQAIVAFMSPLVGAKAQAWGRRPLLILGFAALPLRAFLFASTVDPTVLVVVQMLDGISATVLGVLVPLTIADITRTTGHFNLAQGTVGCAVGIGASISTTVAGLLADNYGTHSAFIAMTIVAALGLATVALLMPETRGTEAG